MSRMDRVCAATAADVKDIMGLMFKVGIPMDTEMFARYFFMTEHELPFEGANGGFVVRDEDNAIVGYCGLTPCPVYRGTTRLSAIQMGVLGVLPGHGAMMFALMDSVISLSDKALVFANTANEKSKKLWTTYGGFHTGTEWNAKIQYLPLPLGVLGRKEFSSESDFERLISSDFFARSLQMSDIFVSDRSPERLRRIWGRAVLEHRVACLLETDNETIVGYAILRKRAFLKGCLSRFDFLDIVSIGDDESVKKRLIRKSKSFASKHGGVLLEYVGGVPLLPCARAALSNTFIWRCGDKTLENGFMSAQGMFGGPYDGDRAMV